MNELLKSVIDALDTIEVRGRYNRNTLSDCVNALESLVAALEAPPAPEPPREEAKEVADG